MCFTLTSLTWASKGLREVDCQGTACTQKEQDYLCLAAPSYCLCILHVYIQHMCMCVHVSLTAWHTHIYTDTHTHTQAICLCRQCVSIWVALKPRHVTYSLLGARLVLASGRTRPRRVLDLTWAMFSGTPTWLIPYWTLWDLSYDRRGSSPRILMSEGFFFKHLFSLQPKWPRDEIKGSQQQENNTRIGFEVWFLQKSKH